MKPYVVALTGASGAIYGIRLLKILVELGNRVDLVISQRARLVIKEELGIPPEKLLHPANVPHALGLPADGHVRAYDPGDLTASIASGSFPVKGMIVAPCSMGSLGAIATGLSFNLIHRAADCAMKEGRKLILVPRETPLNAVHLENMLKLARLGVAIVPAMPAFYTSPSNIQDLADFVVGRVLDQLGVSHFLYPRWVGSVSHHES